MHAQYILRIKRPGAAPFTQDITNTVDRLVAESNANVSAHERACEIWETVANAYPVGAVELLTVTPGRTVCSTSTTTL